MDKPFLPQTLNDWFAIAAIVVVWIAVTWKAWSKLSNDINNLGDRVNTIRDNCNTHSVQVGDLKLEQQASRDDRMNMREKIATNSKGLEALESELREERLAIMTQIHNSDKAAAERDAQTREALAGIRERLNVEQMVKSVVRNLREQS